MIAQARTYAFYAHMKHQRTAVHMFARKLVMHICAMMVGKSAYMRNHAQTKAFMPRLYICAHTCKMRLLANPNEISRTTKAQMCTNVQ